MGIALLIRLHVILKVYAQASVLVCAELDTRDFIPRAPTVWTRTIKSWMVTDIVRRVPLAIAVFRRICHPKRVLEELTLQEASRLALCAPQVQHPFFFFFSPTYLESDDFFFFVLSCS